MTFLDLVFKIGGVPDELTEELHKQAPALIRIAAAIKTIEPDIVAVTPFIQELLAFIESKEGKS